MGSIVIVQMAGHGALVEKEWFSKLSIREDNAWGRPYHGVHEEYLQRWDPSNCASRVLAQ